MNSHAEIKTLWEEFQALPFPRGSKTEDLTVDLAGNEAYSGGCIGVFVETGNLDEGRAWILNNCVNGLRELKARCTPEDDLQKEYIHKLLALSEKVLDAIDENGNWLLL